MNESIMTEVCDKIMLCDVNVELSMPDYEPEVRRLLRVDVRLTPPVSFYDRGRAGMCGEAIFDVLYSGADGGLYTTGAREKYELSEAFKPSEKWDGELVFVCEAQPESLVSRALAPRKLSIKCRVRGRARGFCATELAARSTYTESPESVMRLYGEGKCTFFAPTAHGEISIEDSFDAEFEDLRIIGCDPRVFVESAEAASGGVAVRGELCVDILAVREEGDGVPFKISRALPFAEVIPAEGIGSECRCAARGVCSAVDLGVEGGQIFCSALIMAEVDAERDFDVTYVRDLYSTEVESRTTEKRYEFPISRRFAQRNFTHSIRESAEEAGFDEGESVIDAVSRAVVKSFDTSGENWALVGEIILNCLVLRDGEYSVRELKRPFRYEVESAGGAPFFCDARVFAAHPQVRLEGGRFSCDCELHAGVRICEKAEITALDEAVFGDPITRGGELLVYFPSPTDTVWDVGKRYHVPTEAVISRNPTAFNGNTPTAPIII